MESSEEMVAGSALAGRPASEDGRYSSGGRAQPPVGSAADWAGLADGPRICLVERVMQIHRLLATVRLQANSGDRKQLLRLARGAELQLLALLAELRVQAHKPRAGR